MDELSYQPTIVLIRLYWRHVLFVFAAILVGLLALLAALFMWPRTATLSFFENTCITNPVLFPNSVTTKNHAAFAIKPRTDLTLFGVPIYSHTTCVELLQPTSSGAVVLESAYTSYIPLLQTIIIQTNELPAVTKIEPKNLVSTRDPLEFTISSPDSLHTYQLRTNNKSTNCALVDELISCSTRTLGLKQERSYDFNLIRMFSGRDVEQVFSQKLETVDPLRIINSSIKNGSLVFNKPQQIKIKTNKPVTEYSGISLATSQGEPANFDVELEDKSIVIILNDHLSRQTDYTLTIQDARSADHGFLVKPYKLSFTTSGGPQVKGASIGGYAAPSSGTFWLSFDSEIKSKQNLAKSVWLEVNGKKVSTNLSSQNKTMAITLAGSLGKCTSFTINVSNQLVNKYGVSGGSKWTHNSRTLCRSTFSIGTSVQGRSILAYRFGGGASRVIFVGATHGDEPSSKYALDSFVDNLEANYYDIPKNRTVIVVPSLNPDGVANGTRTNANNVDLNRNFPANNWKSDVIMPGGELNKNGGGKQPLSEPESKAIANYVLSQNPDLVMTYHAIGSLVIANESGNSLSLTNLYGSLTGFSTLGNSQIDGIFEHDITGAFEDWLHDAYGIPAVLVELSSYGANEFWGHHDAMWAMVRF